MRAALLFSAILASAEFASALWPIPTVYETGNSTFWISPDVRLVYEQGGNGTNATASTTGDRKIHDAFDRAKTYLFKENFVPWKFYPHGKVPEPNATYSGGLGTTIKKVVVTQTEADASSKPAYSELKEDYTLSIETGSDSVEISASSSIGVLHALTSLSQLFYSHSNKGMYGAYMINGPINIEDSPKFQHRGLNFDVARQWYDVDTIKKTIEALSWNKMNRLHLHVTDSQSWPLEIPSMPDLAEKGAYAPGLTYSPEEFQDIMDYAEARGVMVITEIDMPGHTTSIAESRPELIAAKNMQPSWDKYAAQPPSGTLKLNNEDVEDFLVDLFADLLPRIKEHTPYFHTGGDEVKANAYLEDPGVASNDTKIVQPALQRFEDHVQAQLAKQDVTPFMWEEMLLEWNLTLPENAIVQTWQSDEATKKVTEAGHRVITGNYNYWYLDCGNGQWLDFTPEAFAGQFATGFADYCSPKKNWRMVYSYDPTGGLTEEEAKLVLGGEVHIWSEQIDPISLDVMLWPRASAAAEVLWSGRVDENGVNRTFADASPRLAEMRERMVARGVGGQPIMQLWCHQNPGNCQL